jgi:hypothetical protein
MVEYLEGGVGSSEPPLASVSAVSLLCMSLCPGTQATLVVTPGRSSLAIRLSPMYALCEEAGVVPRIPSTTAELFRKRMSSLMSGFDRTRSFASLSASKAPTALAL